MRENSSLANKEALTTEDVQGLPLIIPRRTIVIEEIARWLGMEADSLNIVASHNLPTNGLLLVQQGIGCLICVQGSLAIRPPQGIRFVPLAPERITGHVLAWKKNHAFSTATTRFLQFIHSRYNDSAPPIFP